MALRLYDVHKDEFRDVTQADVDALKAVEQAYGKLRSAVARTHEELLNEVAGIQRRQTQAANQPDFGTPTEDVTEQPTDA
jgi:hypothetical protein